MENKFLQNKVVYLKPVPRSGGMVTDQKHIAYFKMEGAYDSYTLKMDEVTKRIINPFKSNEEMEFFSKAFGEDLNPLKPNNPFWQRYEIKIVKTPELMTIGKKFDLSDINDALAYRVLLTWTGEIAPSWDDRLKSATVRYAFMEEDYEEKQAAEELDETFKIGTYYGELKVSDKKMKEFLDVYYMNSPKQIMVPEDYSTSLLVNELNKIIKTDKKGFIRTFEDKDFATKALICKAVDKGVIKKIGVGTYVIDGVSSEYSINELIAQLKDWEETKSDPIYAKIIAVVKSKK
jgi:hypothetical protein